MRRHVREVCDWLEEQGVEVLRTEDGGKHPRVYLVDRNGEEMFYVLPGSPSDRRAMANCQAELRRLLDLRQDTKPRARPRKRYRPRPAPVVRTPDALTVPDDPMAVLTEHPIMPRVRQYRLDEAFKRLWRACCRDVGYRSMI